MSGVQSSTNDVDVDLGRLFRSLLVYWKRILLVALLVTALALALALNATPRYRGETRLLIETGESIFTRPQGGTGDDRPLLDEEGVTSQVQVITSTDLLKRVALELDLAGVPEFDGTADTSSLDRLLIAAGLRNDPLQMPPEERVLNAFRQRLNVYRVEKSRVIVIEMSSEDPKLAAAIPNALADAYIAVQRAAKLDSNMQATDWLEPEIAKLSERVKEAEARVADFRARSDLLTGQNNNVLAAQQLSELSSELSRVKANRAAAEANAAGVRAMLESGASVDALPEIISSPLIQRLRERQIQLNADIADLSTTLLDNHPRIRALRSQLADLDRQIRNEAQNILQGLSTEAEAAKLREQQLTGELNTLKVAAARAGEEEVELRALEREANAQRELLESYLTRFREASSRRDGNYLPADARIFSRAIVPSEPYFPKPLPVAGAAFVGSLFVMSLITLLRELFSGRAMRPAAGFRLDGEDADLSPAPAMAEISPRQPRSPEAYAAKVGPRPEEFDPERSAEPPDEQPAMAAEASLPSPDTPEDNAERAAPEDAGAVVSGPTRRHEPLSDIRLERASFRDAWARHKRVMDAARYVPGRDSSESETAPEGGADATSSSFQEGGDAASEDTKVGNANVESAAAQLIGGGATRAIFVSPDGDEGAAAAVLVAREVADAGLRVLLLDLTASGAAARPMLDGEPRMGITNLLASEAQFNDAIHADHYSECHVMPVGTADPVLAMKSAARLPAIMETLALAYDVVVVECGASDAEGIRRLVADGTEIMVSAIETDEGTIAKAEEMQAMGYGRVMMVSLAA